MRAVYVSLGHLINYLFILQYLFIKLKTFCMMCANL